MKIARSRLEQIIKEESESLSGFGQIPEYDMNDVVVAEEEEESADETLDPVDALSEIFQPLTMKVTRRQLRSIIKEIKSQIDLDGNRKLDSAELYKLADDLDQESGSWSGSFEDLQKKVEKFLIDIKFYEEWPEGSGKVYLFGGSAGHPKGGYTSNIPDVIKAAIASGEIDWASWEDINPIYRKLDRMVD